MRVAWRLRLPTWKKICWFWDLTAALKWTDRKTQRKHQWRLSVCTYHDIKPRGLGSYGRKRFKRKGQLEIETSKGRARSPGAARNYFRSPLTEPGNRQCQLNKWMKAYCWDFVLPHKPLDVLNMVSGRGLHLGWLCARRSKVDFLWKGRRKHCYQSMCFVDSALASVPLPEL